MLLILKTCLFFTDLHDFFKKTSRMFVKKLFVKCGQVDKIFFVKSLKQVYEKDFVDIPQKFLEGLCLYTEEMFEVSSSAIVASELFIV